MGIFSSIGSFVTNVAQKVSNILPTTSVASSVAKSVTGVNVNQAAINIMKANPSTTGKVAVGVAVTGGVALAAPTIISNVATTVVTAAKNVVTAHPITSALVAPVVAGAVVNNPLGFAETTTKVVKAQTDLGKALSSAGNEGIISNAKEFVTEHPIASLVIGGAGVAAAAKGASGLFSYLTTQNLKDSIKDNPSNLPVSAPSANDKANSPAVVIYNNPPPTTNITGGSLPSESTTPKKVTTKKVTKKKTKKKKTAKKKKVSKKRKSIKRRKAKKKHGSKR